MLSEKTMLVVFGSKPQRLMDKRRDSGRLWQALATQKPGVIGQCERCFTNTHFKGNRGGYLYTSRDETKSG